MAHAAFVGQSAAHRKLQQRREFKYNPADTMIGKTLAHYKIEKLLGAGGMGEVYHARDTKLGRSVAVKVLPEALRVRSSVK